MSKPTINARRLAAMVATLLVAAGVTAAPAFAREYAGVYIGCTDATGTSTGGPYLKSYRGAATGLVVDGHKVNYWFNLEDQDAHEHQYIGEGSAYPSGSGYIRTSTRTTPHVGVGAPALIKPYYVAAQFVVYEPYPVDQTIKSSWEPCTESTVTPR